jgi:ribosomal protein S21
MPVEVKKSERESSHGLIRRFSKKIQRSGVLIRARAGRFRKRQKSKQMKKRAALRREKVKKEYEKLRKLGLSQNNGKKRK